MKKFEGKKQYIYWGVTAFAVIAGCIVLYATIARWPIFYAGVTKVFRILSPFIWGFAISYLLRPMMRFFEKRIFARMGARLFPKNERWRFVSARGSAIIVSEALMILIIFLLLRMVLPQIYSSIENLLLNSTTYYDKIVEWVSKVLADYPQLEETFVTVIADMSESLIGWMKTSLLPQMTNLVTNITNGVYYFIRGVYYVVVGVIVSIYILFNKEAVGTGAKKLIYSIFSVPFANKILDGIRFTDKIFMGFISGKVVDSAIIGMLCYICCVLMGMPYAVLVSVIIGVTNVIPFFGPFIGAVPAAFIILIESPIKCLEFVLFIFVLQQFDGNILGPKILGESIGVNGFWVMFSIILGGGLFGFAGMLLGVPVFVVTYTGITKLVDKKLKRNGLPADTAAYTHLNHFDPVSKKAVDDPPQAGDAEPGRNNKPPPRARKDQDGGEDGPAGQNNRGG